MLERVSGGVHDGMTDREKEDRRVLKLILRGKSVKDIMQTGKEVKGLTES